MTFQRNVALQKYNTLAVPSTAEFFYSAPSEAALVEAFTQACDQGLAVSILGGGSNVLLPYTISGLVLQPAFCGIQLVKESGQQVVLRARAATNWHNFVTYCLEHQYFGLENLSLIPGSVGAAPIQNIGAYGVEVSEYVEAIEAFDCKSKRRVALAPEHCAFTYRDSIFKSACKQRYIILAVQFRLSKQARVNIQYPALAQYLQEASLPPTPQNVAAAVVAIRQAKLPQVEDTPNVGSFFKNPIIETQHFLQLKQRFPTLAAFPQEEGYKVAAAWLIEQAGWKGKPHLNIAMHRQQALVLTNPHKLGLDKIMQFAQELQRDIERRFGIVLEIEPQRLEAGHFIP